MTSTRTFFLFVFVFAIIVVLIALVPICLNAQDSATGAIRGTVVDSSGSRMAQASIVVVNTAMDTRYTSTSDREGRFALELLPPGDYSARAEATGMSLQVTPQLHVDVGAAAELEFRRRMSRSPPRPHWSKPSPAPSPRCSMSVRSGTCR